MQLAANLSWLYPDLDWGARFQACARDGFRAAEILLPYDHPPAWYAERLRDAGLTLALINTPVSEGAGRLGWAAVPGAQADFRIALDRARAVAQATGCMRLHVMAGHVAAHDPATCDTALRHNLEWALARTEADGLVLTLEALNRSDMAGYHYHHPDQVLQVLRDLPSPRLRLQYDCYHVAMEGLDAVNTLQACAPWIGHVQIAGVPGRHEPDLGQGKLLEAVSALPRLGYDSWLGCEYQPRTTAAAGLGWCEPLRAQGVLA